MKAPLLLWLGGFLVYAAASLMAATSKECGVFDLGIMYQTLWLLGHGLAPWLTTRGLLADADHFNPLAGLLAPLVAWSGTSASLLLIQALSLSAGVVPLMLMARERGFSPRAQVAVGIVFLIQPGQLFLNLFDFHFNAFTGPAVLWGAWALERGRADVYRLALLVLLGTTEAAGLSVLALVPVAGRLRGWRWAAGTGVAGLAALAVARFSLVAASAGQPSAYRSLYAHWGASVPEVVTNLVLHPGPALAVGLPYAAVLLSGWAGLPLLSPLRACGALPVFLGNVLASRPNQVELVYHYTAAIDPFLAWAALAALGRLGRPGAVWLLALAACPAFLHGPLASTARELSAPPLAERPAPDRSVSASTWVGARLAGRERLFNFPNPFSLVAWGNSARALTETMLITFPPPLAALRRGFDDAPVDDVIVNLDLKSQFPLRRGALWFCLDALLRHPGYGGPLHGREAYLKRGRPPDPTAPKWLFQAYANRPSTR